MKKFLQIKLFFSILLAWFGLMGNAQDLQWAKSIGSTGYDYGNSIAIDANGNMYITGYFYGTVDFDPGVGSMYLSSEGGSDIFFSKYDSIGNFLWAKSIGSFTVDVGMSIAVDAAGNVYITGFFNSTADFNPGSGTANLTAAGNNDIYIAKYNSFGNYLWAKRIGDTGYDVGRSIAVDKTGNVYITGTFFGPVDFDPNAGTQTLNTFGQADIFIAKYSGNGNYVWAKNIGGNYSDVGQSIFTDSNAIYIAGYFKENIKFYAGMAIDSLSAVGAEDIFFAKYDFNGNNSWLKSIGSTGIDYGQGITADINGNIFVTGYFKGTADFDAGTGIDSLTIVDSADVFFTKYDSLGNYLWAKSIGSTGNDYGNSIATDANGNVFIAGYFKNSADFDPNTGSQNLTSMGAEDIFFAKYDADGNYLWAKSIGNTAADRCQSIAIGNSGNVFIAGIFNGTVDFDSGTGISNLTSNGVSDIFFAKYNESGNFIVNNNSKDNLMIIFPNPTAGKFTLQVTNNKLQMQNMGIKIYNIFGEKIHHSEISNLKSEIDLNNQPKGIYFVQVNDVEKIYKNKLIVE